MIQENCSLIEWGWEKSTHDTIPVSDFENPAETAVTRLEHKTRAVITSSGTFLHSLSL